MTERVIKPLSFWVAIKEIANFYCRVFKHILGLVVIAALIQALISALIPENPVLAFTISLFGSIIAMFFYAWILYRADSVLMNRPEGVKDALQVAKKRFLPVLGVLAIYVAIVLLFILFGFGMQLLGNLLHVTWLMAAITILVLLFIMTLLAFTMPAVILDKMPVFKAFEYSVKLVWGHFWHTFGVMAVYLIPVILFSFLMVFFTSNLVVITIYEFIYHIITYPLMISLILILYYDLKSRHNIEGFKHIAEKP